MLQQTAASSDRSRVLHTGDSGTPVDLGEFAELVYHHDTAERLRFSLSWTAGQQIEIEDVLKASPSVAGSNLGFGAEIYQASDGALRVGQMGYTLRGDAGSIRASMVPKSPQAQPRKFDLEIENFTAVRNPGRAWPLPQPARFYGFPEEAVGYFQNTQFLSELTLALERELDSIYYLGPLRQDPERFYVWSGATPEHVGWRGERTVEAILASAERLYNTKYRGAMKHLDAVLAEWLKQLDLIEDFALVPIAQGRRHREVRVRVKGSRDDVLITDVGFGVSQVLPVLVQCLYADPGSTLIFEQPELHLHPKVQMELADVLIQAAFQVREHSAPRGVQLIIESHSEHFLRRLQRRIAEEELRPDQVALYFCGMSRGESSVTELNVDIFGDITNWPRDFFGDQMEDVTEQARARLRRRVAEASEPDG